MSSTDAAQEPDRVEAEDEFAELDGDVPAEFAENPDTANLAEDEDTARNVDDGASESLRGLILYLATNLVDDPEAVDVGATRRGSVVDLRLTVPEEELGRIIGRQGRIARALRTSLMVAASRHNLRVSLDIEPTA